MMHEEFYKARRNLSLASSVLIAWIAIGIEIGEYPLPNVAIKLLSPGATPYVLLALVVYFGFRTTIEWYRAPVDSRGSVAAKIDFYFAHALGLVSVGMFFFEETTGLRVAQVKVAWILSVVAFLIPGVATFSSMVFSIRQHEGRSYVFLTLGLVLCVLVSYLSVRLIGLPHGWPVLVPPVSGLALALVFIFGNNR